MPQTLEAEIVEIDGKPPQPQPDLPPGGGRGGGARAWTVRLDRRWWPLWVLLGGVVLVVGLTLGVVAGAAYLVFATIRTVFRLFFGQRQGH